MNDNLKIAVVLKGYPRLSETFIAQELLELQRAGFDLTIVSLRHPTDTRLHPYHEEITAPLLYLPEYLHQEPIRVLKALASGIRQPNFLKTAKLWWQDLRRDFTSNRVRRFGQALVLANELPTDTCWLYAHFLHTPASVTRYCASLVGLNWSCSAHARDIWTSPDWELTEKIDSLMWLVTCTRVGCDHLKSVSSAPDKVSLVYHGLDLSRFPQVHRQTSANCGQDRQSPVQIVTVGRAVEKKGLDTLIDALAQLPDSLAWHWVHIGGGTLSNALKQQVSDLSLDENVTFLGAQPQAQVLDAYSRADMFVLPCRIASDGDRDGLPNVLVEAQSQGLPVISTPVSAIGELIEDQQNGLLVPPNDVSALKDAMQMLITDPELRHRLGQFGADKVHSQFSHLSTIGKLIDLFKKGFEKSRIKD